MKKRKTRLLILLLCVLLCACGSAPAEAPAEPPAQESSLPPESSSSSPATIPAPAPAEPKINIIDGYSLEEMGYMVVFPEELAELEDPNDSISKPYFQASDSIHYGSSFSNGNSTTVDIWVADNQIAYNSYILRTLQCYKPSELTDEKARVRLKEEYYDLAALEQYQIYRGDDVMICDLTDLYYEEIIISEESCHGFAEYLSFESQYCHEYDNSWLLEQYNYFGDHILEMIYDGQGNAISEANTVGNLTEYAPDQQAFDLWEMLVGYWNGPKNRFIVFDFNEEGQPVFWAGLYDADGGRGYGKVIDIAAKDDGTAVVKVFYPVHPENEIVGYLPPEIMEVTISSYTDAEMIVQYSNYPLGPFYKEGSDFETAYEAYAALNHNW